MLAACFLLDGGVRFEFFLAERLKMTVEELRHRLTYHEFQQWAAYFHVQMKEAERAAKPKALGSRLMGRA